jgi:hypothetical protein
VIHGHWVTHDVASLVPGKAARYGIFLRDPAERILSAYNFEVHMFYRKAGRRIPSFSEWYAGYPKNYICLWFCSNFLDQEVNRMSEKALFESARDALDQFWFVGFTESFNQDTTYLMSEIGLPPVTGRTNTSGIRFPRTVVGNKALLEKLTEENRNDSNLVNHFRQKAYQFGRNK